MIVDGVLRQSTKLHIENGNIQTTRGDPWIDGTLEITVVSLFVSKAERFEMIDKAL